MVGLEKWIARYDYYFCHFNSDFESFYFVSCLTTVDAGIQLDAVQTNLVDAIWTEASGRPKPNPRPIYIHDIAYAGNKSSSWK